MTQHPNKNEKPIPKSPVTSDTYRPGFFGVGSAGPASANPAPSPTPTKPCSETDATCGTGKDERNSEDPARPTRPGANVHTDRSGKTYEGKTGISGETDEVAGEEI